MKKVLIVSILIGVFIIFWFLMKPQVPTTLVSTATSQTIPTATPTPIPIDSSTDLNMLLDSTTPEKFDGDFQNLTESAK